MSLSVSPDMRTFVSGACDASAKVRLSQDLIYYLVSLGNTNIGLTNAYAHKHGVLFLF